ncbi:MAG: CBS domain-containing protein [Dehalococcoidia bacterium]|nr:CBS domain-containing protein [Chloroflexota bacterium]MXX17936.1 CBS domain-containing protein [Dehalococcoidia bacterium]MXY72346.1 CBS domain-containing protein [Dehalococcoidia bacterium]MYD27885.1 CBS domain-containing protein [Dehalococcoidia bacterium]
MTRPSGTELVTCPLCGEQNIAGVDRCENCLQPLRSMDIPEPDQALSESAFSAPLASLRLLRPPAIAPTASVRDAVNLLVENKGGAVLVVDGDSLSGIFTERDVLKKVAGRPGALDAPVAEYMTTDPVVVRENETVAVALHKMADGGFRHVPMGTRQGYRVVTASDALKWVVERYIELSA